MILNLSSRKQFWIKRKQRKVLANKIKEKIPDVDDDGNPRDFRRIRISDARGKITKVDFQLKAFFLIGQERYLVNIILKSSLRLRLFQMELKSNTKQVSVSNVMKRLQDSSKRSLTNHLL